jgi:hypothetical protein
VKFNTNTSKKVASEPKLTCQIQLGIARSCTTEALRTAALLFLALTEALKMNSIEEFYSPKAPSLLPPNRSKEKAAL